MEIHNLEETNPTLVGEETQEMPSSGDETPPSADSHKSRWGTWLLWGLLGLILLGVFIVAGSYLGYQQGINDRTGFEATAVAIAIEEQYELGVQDMDAGNYEVARQRFDYVIQDKSKLPRRDRSHG